MRTIGLLPLKSGTGKFPLFRGNGEQVIPIYGGYIGIFWW